MYKYIEIANTLEREIKASNQKPGERVASVRTLCKTYKCHQSTAVKALNYLKEKNIIYSIPQSGYYITGKVDSKPEEDQSIDFKTASPDSRFFPYLEYQKCVNLAIEKNQTRLFKYSNMEGYLPLKDSIRKLITHDYLFVNAESIVITTGIQQCLSILTELSMSNGRKKILIEQPTYHCYIDYLKLNGIEVETIERDYNGINLSNLEAIFAKGEIKFFYTMARVHNPLGTKLSKDTKEKIMELAYRYNVFIVEDDYMADYVTDKSNDPLFTYDLKGTHAIYLRSFSKSIFPGLRVGFAVLPKDMVSDFAQKKYYQDMGTSLLAQASLDVYLRNRMYDKHMSKMINLYAARAHKLRTILSEFQVEGSFSSNYDASTIHVCLDAGSHFNLPNMNRKHINVANIQDYYYSLSGDIQRYLPINVSNVTEKQIAIGIKRLMKLSK